MLLISDQRAKNAGARGSAGGGTNAGGRVERAFMNALKSNFTLTKLGLDLRDPTCRHAVDRAILRNAGYYYARSDEEEGGEEDEEDGGEEDEDEFVSEEEER